MRGMDAMVPPLPLHDDGVYARIDVRHALDFFTRRYLAQKGLPGFGARTSSTTVSVGRLR